jgi:hypothetical protein
MDKVKLFIQFHQRLRSAQKKVAAEIQVAEEMVDHF